MAVTHDPTYLRTWAPFVHGLFVQGLDTWWTDDGSGDAWGSVISGLTDRTCKPGLTVPKIRMAIDPQTGWLQNSVVSFKLLDHDEHLAQLFGDEPAASTIDVLAKTVLASTSPLTSVYVQGAGQLDTIDPSGRYIGIERIGPSGERNHFSPFNSSLLGLYHPVDQSSDPITPRVLVSDDPMIFEGRLVALYRFYLEERLSGASKFGTFANAELVWWGVLRDKAEITGDRVWSMSCYGPEGLLKRQLNASTQTYVRGAEDDREDGGWFPIQTTITLSDEERKIGVFFSSHSVGGATHEWFKSSWAHASNDLTSGQTPLEFADEINTVVQNVASGTNCTHTGKPADSLSTFVQDPWPGSTVGANSARVALGEVRIEGLRYTSAARRYAQMDLVLHERVWRAMGWDPTPVEYGGQNIRTVVHGKVTDVQFFRHDDDGWPLYDWVEEGDNVEPKEGYVVGRFWTIPIGEDRMTTRPENDNTARVFKAIHEGGISVLDLEGGQDVRLPYDAPFWEGQLFGEAPDADHQIDSQNLDSTRYFAVRGRFRPAELWDDSEAEEVVQVCKASWVDVDGHVGEDASGAPTVYVEYWLDPRLFGFPHAPLTGRRLREWVEAVGGHEIAPLATLTYHFGDAAELRYLLWLRILASTGTAYRTGLGSSSILYVGDNTVGTLGNEWQGDDLEIAPMGLGVPADLIADTDDVRDAFDAADTGGWRSPLQHVRIGWLGPLNSEELLDSLTAPVGLGYRLHGGAYGLFPLFLMPGPQAVDLTIGEDDVAETDPPSHGRRLEGQFSEVTLEYRLDPAGKTTVLIRRAAALDRGARWRPGNLKHTVRDWGLLPTPWIGDVDKRKKIIGASGWGTLWHELWAVQAAGFFAERNFTVRNLRIAREKGQDVWPGTLLRLTNPWPQNPAQGTYGLTNALARVLEVVKSPHGDVECEVLVYGASLDLTGGVYYAPAVRLRGYNTSTRVAKVDANWPLSAVVADNLAAMVKPSWCSSSGSMRLKLYRYDRRSWTAGPEGTVESVDTANLTITFASPGLTSTYYRDSDYIAIPAEHDDEDQGQWVRDLFGVITRDDGTFGASNTQGRRFVDA